MNKGGTASFRPFRGRKRFYFIGCALAQRGMSVYYESLASKCKKLPAGGRPRNYYKRGGNVLDILAVLLIVAAAAIFLLGRILAKRQAEVSQRLAEQLFEEAKEIDSKEKASKETWDDMWDEAHEQIDEDVYRLLKHTSGIFKGIAAALVAAALALLLAARFL